MKLSILIPIAPEHTEIFKQIRDKIIETIPFEMLEYVEILSDDRDRKTKTGTKRNDLLAKAKGEYVWFIDADDMIEDYAMSEVLKGIESDADVICFNGYMTTNGFNRVDWEIRLGHPYTAVDRDGKEYYLRFPNHISPMKREKALQVKFPDVTLGEDYAWAKKIHDQVLLKSEYVIDKIIYHYQYNSKK